jgi:hypothetical protein
MRTGALPRWARKVLRIMYMTAPLARPVLTVAVWDGSGAPVAGVRNIVSRRMGTGRALQGGRRVAEKLRPNRTSDVWVGTQCTFILFNHGGQDIVLRSRCQPCLGVQVLRTAFHGTTASNISPKRCMAYNVLVPALNNNCLTLGRGEQTAKI